MKPKLNHARQSRRQDSLQEPQAQSDTNGESREQQAEVDQIAFLVHVVPPWLVSMLVHLSLILILAILTIAQVQDKQVSLTLETVKNVDEFENISVVSFDEPQQLDPMQSLAESEDISINELESPIALSTAEDVALNDLGSFDLGADLGAVLGAEIDLVGEEIGTTRFFGTEQEGQKFVFVVDNSNSMTKGKFETALRELDKTIDELTPEQQFHVIFFSDTAYLMFHPKPVKNLVFATEKNKERLREWLYSVEMCLKTRGEDAIKAAIAMRPDVIYILGDGAFTDNTEDLLTAPHKRKIVINTLGMQVNSKGARQLKSIAKANKGKYRAVDTAPAAVAMAKRNPINRNRIRGRIWGVDLPKQEKKK